MDERRIAKLKRLAKLFNAKSIVTIDDIEYFLNFVLETIKGSTDKFEKLSSEHISKIDGAIDFIEKEYPKFKESLNQREADFLATYLQKTREISERLDEIKAIKSTPGKDGYTPIKGKDYFDGKKGDPGEPGKPADEEKIVKNVLKRIKFPDPVVETGPTIVAKINELPTDNDDFKIDWKHIKNAPAITGPMGGTRYLSRMADVVLTNLANDEVLKWSEALQKWVNGTGGSGGSVTSVNADVGPDVVLTVVNSGSTLEWDGTELKIPTATAAVNGLLSSADWTTFNDKLSAAITSLGGLTGAVQTFATPGTTGTAPNWVSAGTAHTLHIPMAATASVTAGLISKAQYDVFNAKESALTFSSGLTRVTNTITNDLITGLAGGQTVIGGTAVTDRLNYKGTTGNGTLTAIAHQFLVGNNGATNALTILNNGRHGIGTQAPQFPFESVVGSATAIGIRGTGANNQVDLTFLNSVNNIGTNAFSMGYAGSGFSTVFASNGLTGAVGYIQQIGNQAIQIGTNNIARITILGGGNVAFGAINNPGNIVEINGASANTSGLRFRRLTSASPAVTGNPLGVDANGDVVRIAASVTAPGGLTGQVQYNNGGSFGGAGRSFIDNDGETYFKPNGGTQTSFPGGRIHQIVTNVGNVDGTAVSLDTFQMLRNTLKQVGDVLHIKLTFYLAGTGTSFSNIMIEIGGVDFWNTANGNGGLDLNPQNNGYAYFDGYAIVDQTDNLKFSGTLSYYNDKNTNLTNWNDYRTSAITLSADQNIKIIARSDAGAADDIILVSGYYEMLPYWR